MMRNYEFKNNSMDSLIDTSKFNFDIDMCDKSVNNNDIDVSETNIRESLPKILDLLLIDRTKSTDSKKVNIIWANNNYINYDKRYYQEEKQIKPEHITGPMESIIKPRALKSDEIQKIRTKGKAEVFTPTWMVKKQNDLIDINFRTDDIEKYTGRKWLEITCGEAPYMVTRYDMQTGKYIEIINRVGFLDRKLRRITDEIDEHNVWLSLVYTAYKASYGYEWNGDSLLLARENLLYTFIDYYIEKWSYSPSYELVENIATIISYNVFQMDGLNFMIPLSEKYEVVKQQQISLFGDDAEFTRVIKRKGKRVKIMNWTNEKMEYFDKGVS